MRFNAEDAEPDTELMNQIPVGPGGSADGGVVSPALGVVLALDDVHSQRALVAWDAVGAVEVEEEVAHAQRAKLGDLEAADSGEGRSQAVPVVSQRRRAPG